MPPHITLGRVFGISIGLHLSWFLIALLITLSLAAHFSSTNPVWTSAAVWVSAIVTGLLFFAAIVLHELAHALVARARGVPVRSITLFALGGVSNIEKDVGDAKTEFWMGIAGPLMSVAVGLLCLGLVWALGGFEPGAELTPRTPPMAVFAWLGYINLVLAAFNMIPGFPLDGGRVLRAALWGMHGDKRRATRTAARTGQVVAALFIVLGFLGFFGGGGFGALWIAIIGWFLLSAAGASLVQLEMLTGLQGLRVRDVMTQDCVRIEPGVSLQTLADEYVLRTGQRCFLVAQDGAIRGLVAASDLKAVERERWPRTSVEAVMRPLERLQTVRPETPLADALEIMGRHDVNQLPVLSNGRLEGMLTRGQILRVLESRAELGM
ncbi:site-2 protease family protein [Candidatus Nitrospira bockiana]